MSTAIAIGRHCRLYPSFLCRLNRTKNNTFILGSNSQQTRGLKQYQEKTVRAMYWRGRSFDRASFEKRRSEYQDWNYRSEIFAFSRRLQENLDENTLREIFAHPSYVEAFRENQAKYNLPDIGMKPNTHLVHRGCALLDECIKPYLRYTFSRMPEDGIVAITNYLKSERVLADIAKWIGCKEIILVTEYPPGPTTMADTIKALLAGVERDLGLERTRRFIVDMIISYLNDKDILEDVWVIPNPRETLNLILANTRLPAYEPRIMFQTGVKTLESCHIVGLYTNKKFLGSSAGETLDIAEECAAIDSLQRIFELKENRQPYTYGEASEQIDYAAHKIEHDDIKKYKLDL